MKTERIDRVRTALRAAGLTQMIVCDPKSIWYLTGVCVDPYERLLALYLPVDGEPVLFLNRLFHLPKVPCRAIWHTDTDARWHRLPPWWTPPPRWASTRSGRRGF